MNIFKDNNDWNEKSIIGAVAFVIMCLVVLGCFGIAGLEKFAKK